MTNMKKGYKSHCELILEDLRKGKKITPRQAMLDYGCMRLGARIYDLRKAGYDIKSKMIEVPTRSGHTRVSQYWMEEEE